MAKRVDTSGLDADYVINQAKSSNRNKELKPYDPSASTSTEERTPEADAPLVEQPETVKEKEAPREETKRRRGKAQSEAQDYEALFFKESAFKTRNGKVVYIRKEFHDRILKIVRVIGENEFSLFSYLDNVLEHHFNTFQDDITDLYNKRNTDVF